MSRSFIKCMEDGWYWWDETEAFVSGPYKTREEAEDALESYALSLEYKQPEVR